MRKVWEEAHNLLPCCLVTDIERDFAGLQIVDRRAVGGILHQRGDDLPEHGIDWHWEVQLLDGRQSQLVEQHRSGPAVGAGEGHEIGVDPQPIKVGTQGNAPAPAESASRVDPS